jgi:hypothetical protein
MSRGILKARGTAISSLFTAALLLGAPASAEEPQWIAASAGQFDVFNKGNGVEVGWELRFAPRRLRFLPEFVPELAPIAGAMGTSQGTLYAFGGFRLDVPLDERWMLSPSAMGGFYHRGTRGQGKDLGGPVEFRTGFELSVRLGERSRLGLTLSHLSNGGVFDFNPGSESLVLTWSARP